MNEKVRLVLPEIVRTVVAIAAALGASAGYLEFAGSSRMLANVDQARLESVARPDRWTGTEGRANTSAITRMATVVSELQLGLSSLDLRVVALEGREIPPRSFEKKVDRIEQKLDKLAELVTELRIAVGRTAGE